MEIFTRKKTDFYDVFGDGVIKIIFTPGHTPGHQSVLVNLPKTGHMLFTGDACYTGDHWLSLIHISEPTRPY